MERERGAGTSHSSDEFCGADAAVAEKVKSNLLATSRLGPHAYTELVHVSPHAPSAKHYSYAASLRPNASAAPARLAMQRLRTTTHAAD